MRVPSIASSSSSHNTRNVTRLGEGKVVSLFGSLKDDGWGALFYLWMFSEYVSFVTGYQQYLLSECVVLRDLGVSLTHAIILILIRPVGVAIPSLI